MRSSARLTRTDPNPQERLLCVRLQQDTPPNEVTCDEVKGAADLRKVISELVVGQKILTENLQK